MEYSPALFANFYYCSLHFLCAIHHCLLLLLHHGPLLILHLFVLLPVYFVLLLFLLLAQHAEAQQEADSYDDADGE